METVIALRTATHRSIDLKAQRRTVTPRNEDIDAPLQTATHCSIELNTPPRTLIYRCEEEVAQRRTPTYRCKDIGVYHSDASYSLLFNITKVIEYIKHIIIIINLK